MILKYENVYRAYQHRRDYLTDIFGFFIKAKLAALIQKDFLADLDKAYHALYPRRKRVDWTQLPEEVLKPIQEKWSATALRLLEIYVRQAKTLDKMLWELAPVTEIKPLRDDSAPVKTANSSTFSSQGWGADKYARESLAFDLSLLQEAGFTASIEGRKLSYGYEFDLMTNAYDWQLDCLQRRSPATLLDWAVSCWDRSVNPKVYSPFLPQDIFDRSMEIHMGKFKKKSGDALVK